MECKPTHHVMVGAARVIRQWYLFYLFSLGIMWEEGGGSVHRLHGRLARASHPPLESNGAEGGLELQPWPSPCDGWGLFSFS